QRAPVRPISGDQPRPKPDTYKPGSNKVAGLGIPERWALILPCLPFWLAIVAAVTELLLVSRTDSKIRFHAAQGMALQIVITAITTLLYFAGFASGRWTGSGL